jgi:exodeoxyribonuclease-5
VPQLSDQPDIKSLLLQHFPYTPTTGQGLLLDKLALFISNRQERSLFVLKGYAGTGKTTIVGALVKALPRLQWKSVLLAPTGRAAKVLAGYAEKPAFTIHKKIYQRKSKEEGSYFQMMQNLHTNSIFIVDEASMISNQPVLSGNSFQQRRLLTDLFEYVYHGKNCKLILIGDDAQLPPVGIDESPALNPVYLKREFHLKIDGIELKEVVRQEESSGILYNATTIRNDQKLETIEFPHVELEGFEDTVRIDGMELQDELEWAYGNYSAEETMVVCRSNKRANIFNQQIRSRILWHEDEIAAGDLMMVVKNNYFWLGEESKAGFIANGDTVVIQKIVKMWELYGFRFADVIVRMVDYPDEPELETKIILDSIMEEGPSIKGERMREFFYEVEKDYMDIPNKRKRYQKVFDDPFFNALQVKFAYAVTCHKSQGGQWPVVFVDQGYLTDEMMDKEYLRWLYTAVTRATKKLYLVNFHDRFFEEKEPLNLPE